MAGCDAGAMLLEYTHPEDMEQMPALFPEAPAPLCLQLRALAGGCRAPPAGKSLSASPVWGGCGSGRFCKDECRSMSECSGCPMLRVGIWCLQHGNAHRWMDGWNPQFHLIPLVKLWMLCLTPLPPDPGLVEFIHSAAQMLSRWTSAASAAAPLPMPGRVIPVLPIPCLTLITGKGWMVFGQAAGATAPAWEVGSLSASACLQTSSQ